MVDGDEGDSSSESLTQDELSIDEDEGDEKIRMTKVRNSSIFLSLKTFKRDLMKFQEMLKLAEALDGKEGQVSSVEIVQGLFTS